jgi:hypothetical protein
MQRILSIRVMRKPDGKSLCLISALDENRQYVCEVVDAVDKSTVRSALTATHKRMEANPKPVPEFPSVEKITGIPF